MTPRTFLVVMTAIAVVGDSLLHPFYPQYFQSVFGVSDPTHVGLYVAACSLAVLLAFPVWAALSRKVPALSLLVATQAMTAILAGASFAARSVGTFWAASLAMMVFKASYLLIYPYVMSLEEKSRHPQNIGLLAFVVYFGNILAAIAAGFFFEALGPRALFLAMASADVLQMVLCVVVARSSAFSRPHGEPERASREARKVPAGFFLRLGIVMFTLYFSAYVTEPFFAAYWEAASGVESRLLSGIAFALPGMTALLALALDARSRERDRRRSVLRTLGLVAGGLMLQGSGSGLALVVGRCVYGWGLFRTMVELDLIVFRVSAPSDYAVDFSRANFFQGLGVMVASSVAGTLVHGLGLGAPFVMALLGFLLGAAGYAFLVQRALPATVVASPLSGNRIPTEVASQ
jgi:DHA1 family multidrug resistance protein-like MFS transporter